MEDKILPLQKNFIFCIPLPPRHFLLSPTFFTSYGFSPSSPFSCVQGGETFSLLLFFFFPFLHLLSLLFFSLPLSHMSEQKRERDSLALSPLRSLTLFFTASDCFSFLSFFNQLFPPSLAGARKAFFISTFLVASPSVSRFSSLSLLHFSISSPALLSLFSLFGVRFSSIPSLSHVPSLSPWPRDSFSFLSLFYLICPSTIILIGERVEY